MTVEFHISLGGEPIYRQIGDRVRRAVAVGRLTPGDPLPSIRALAERLVVNPNTVARAYRELVAEGVLEARQGVGYVAAERRRVYSVAERRRRLDRALEPLIGEALALDLAPEEILKALEKKLRQLRRGGKAKGSL